MALWVICFVALTFGQELPAHLSFLDSGKGSDSRLLPVKNCEDNNVGLNRLARRFGLSTSGCADVRHFCSHPRAQRTAQRFCPVTCGLCEEPAPTNDPTADPTVYPTDVPTSSPTQSPTLVPTDVPTSSPTLVPTQSPTDVPTYSPTDVPTLSPTQVPTDVPTSSPTQSPTLVPTDNPTSSPTQVPTDVPTSSPTQSPTLVPTDVPTSSPTLVPTQSPTDVPTYSPTDVPTLSPTQVPTDVPTSSPTQSPTLVPTDEPTSSPTQVPTQSPTIDPTSDPTAIVIGSAFEKVGDGFCADADGNTNYNYCQWVDPWGGFAHTARGGVETCLQMLDYATKAYKVTGMYYLERPQSEETQCFFYFANPEDVPNSWLNDPNRHLTHCTDGSQLDSRPALGDITQTVGDVGECFVRRAELESDECTLTLANLNMPEADYHFHTGAHQGLGGMYIGSETYFCPPGMYSGSPNYAGCTPCTTPGYGAQGEYVGGTCVGKPGIAHFIGGMGCWECTEGLESFVLDNGGRVCVPSTFANDATPSPISFTWEFLNNGPCLDANGGHYNYCSKDMFQTPETVEGCMEEANALDQTNIGSLSWQPHLAGGVCIVNMMSQDGCMASMPAFMSSGWNCICWSYPGTGTPQAYPNGDDYNFCYEKSLSLENAVTNLAAMGTCVTNDHNWGTARWSNDCPGLLDGRPVWEVGSSAHFTQWAEVTLSSPSFVDEIVVHQLGGSLLNADLELAIVDGAGTESVLKTGGFTETQTVSVRQNDVAKVIVRLMPGGTRLDWIRMTEIEVLRYDGRRKL